MSVATKNYIKNSVERLYGIISGITINYHINEKEIIALRNWMNTHDIIHHVEPFKELDTILTDILADGVIDDDEKDCLLDWCSDTLNEKGYLTTYTQIMRRLHGLFSGIMCDNIIKPNELEGLRDWLFDYEYLHGWWPINELIPLINDVLADQKIDEKEHQRLQEFFSDFEEQIIHDPTIYDDEYWINSHVMSISPIFKPISSICEINPVVIFNKRTFCFTGPAATAQRKDLFNIITDLGGVPCKNPIKDLDFLVIGAQSSPAWVYSTYGRKIEAIMQRKQVDCNCQTKIIKEYDFIQAVKNVGGEDIFPNPNRPAF